jgi:hypothetical protein
VPKGKKHILKRQTKHQKQTQIWQIFKNYQQEFDINMIINILIALMEKRAQNTRTDG